MNEEKFNRAIKEAKSMTPEPKIRLEQVKMAAQKTEKSRRRLWIGFGSLLGGVAVTGTIVALSLGALGGKGWFPTPGGSLDALALPKNAKKTNDSSYQRSLSKTTYDSYLSFIPKFASLMLDPSKEGESVGLSIPDAYLCFALAAYTSTGATQQEWFDFLGLASEDEILTAAKEVRQALCTLREDDKKNLFGGYNLNALWFNLAKVYLLEGKEEEYQKIADAFDAALFKEALTTENANAYLKDYGLKDLPVPKMSFPDEDPYAAAAMSVFYCLDGFGEKEDLYKKEYQGKSHYMDYAVAGSTQKTDFLSLSEDGYVFDGDGFYGASLPIHDLRSSFFLTEDADGDPASIFDKILTQAYQERTYVDEFSGDLTPAYKVNVNSPYFKIDSEIAASEDKMDALFPSSRISGLFEELAMAYEGGLFLAEIKQMSTMSFDYSGFYSCSVTVVEAGNTSVSGPSQSFAMDLNRPFVFEISQPDVLVGAKSEDIPMVFGEVYQPNYPAYGK